MSGIFTEKKLLSLLEKHPHGTRHRYEAGCRCLLCRAAHADYRSLCLRRQKLGISDPLVPAGPIVKHLTWLRSIGVGYRPVSVVTGVHPSVLQRVKNGQHKWIKKSSAAKILGVTADAAADHGRVDATETWQLVDRLLKQGFTYRELSRRAQVASSVLVARKPHVAAITRMKIEKFYNRITIGGEQAA